MAPNITVRLAEDIDPDAIASLVFEAVHSGNDAYTEAEKRAWMPSPPSGPQWRDRLSREQVWIAERGSQLVGTMTLGQGGYIDLAYIVASHRGYGLFRRLYHELEGLAAERGVERLWVHASLMAQPAFAAMGFDILKPDPVEKAGQVLCRFEMEKRLQQTGSAA